MGSLVELVADDLADEPGLGTPVAASTTTRSPA